MARSVAQVEWFTRVWWSQVGRVGRMGRACRTPRFVLIAFAVVFTALNVASYTRTSATWDEPQHLAAGYAALAAGDYRVDPEHPPLVRLWAALVVRAVRGRALDTSAIDAATPSDWVSGGLFTFAHDLVYVRHNADRWLYASRFMILILGLALGALLFGWAREWLGAGAAAAVLAAYTLEPNMAAHASLVTNDFGVTCFAFGTVYFLWRLSRKPTLASSAAFHVRWRSASTIAFASGPPDAGFWPVMRRPSTTIFGCQGFTEA